MDEKRNQVAQDPFRDLANAVILQAIEDWRQAKAYLCRHEKSKDPVTKQNCEIQKGTLKEVESFFLSGEFGVFSGLDGKWLLDKIKKDKRILRYGPKGKRGYDI